jgi:protein gp37
MASRMRGRYGYPADDPFRPGWWHQEAYDKFKPLKGKKVFVCSMSDLFHEETPVRAISLVMEKINSHRDTIFMLLTKRPERMKYFLGERAAEWKSALSWEYDIPLPNLWIGVTAENQPNADKRTKTLLQIPAAVRFVSVEPMLGPVSLVLRSPITGCVGNKIDWVICGGETGPGARPVHPDWVRALRDQCVDAGVPFFF